MKSSWIALSLLLVTCSVHCYYPRADTGLLDHALMSALTLIDCNDHDLDRSCNCAFDTSSNRSYMICPNLLDESINRMPNFDRVESVAIVNAFSSWPMLSSAYVNTVELDMSHNNLSGAIGDLTNLLDSAQNHTNTNLRYLNLSYNKLTRLSVQLCFFVNLHALDLSFNQFEHIDFSDFLCNRTHLNGEIFYLSSLRELYLNNNWIHLVSSFDAVLFGMPTMSSLDLSSNNLSSIHIACYSAKVIINLNNLFTKSSTNESNYISNYDQQRQHQQQHQSIINKHTESLFKSLFTRINYNFNNIRIKNNNLKSLNLNINSFVYIYGLLGLDGSLIKAQLKRNSIDLNGNNKIDCTCNLYGDLIVIHSLFKSEMEESNQEPDRMYLLFDEHSNCLEQMSKTLSKQHSFYKLITRDICSSSSNEKSKVSNAPAMTSDQQALKIKQKLKNAKRLDVCQSSYEAYDDYDAASSFFLNHLPDYKKSINYMDKNSKQHSSKPDSDHREKNATAEQKRKSQLKTQIDYASRSNSTLKFSFSLFFLVFFIYCCSSF